MPLPQRSVPVLYISAAPDGHSGPAVRMDLAKRVISLKYKDREAKADKLELTLDNGDLSLFDDPAFCKGMIWEVSWGYPGNMSPVRQVVVTSAHGGRELTIVALAKSILINTKGKTRTFTGMKRSDVVKLIAKEAGYGPDVQHIEESKVTVGTIHQAGLTDAQLIAQMAKLEGMEFYVDLDGLHFHRRKLGQRPIRVFHYFTPPLVGEVVDFRLKNDVFSLPGRTTLKGRDPLERQDFTASADAKSDSDRDTLGDILEVVDPEDGSSADRPRNSLEQRMGSEEVHSTSSSTAAEANEKAKARFRNMQQEAVKLELDVVGDPLMVGKTVVEVRGLGKRLSGKYYVRTVEHQVDGSGYKTVLEMVSDGHGGHSTESTVAPGLSLVDPGAPAGGKPNTKEPAEGDDLEEVEDVDEETGKTRTRYRDSGGRKGEDD